MNIEEIRVLYEDADESIPFGANFMMESGDKYVWLGGNEIQQHVASRIDIGSYTFVDSWVLKTPQPTLAEVVEFIKSV